MRGVILTAALMGACALTQVSAQQTDQLTTSFACSASYPKGKNIYLMDSCRVNYTVKKVVGKTGVNAQAVWTARKDFTYNKVKVERDIMNGQKLYGGLGERFDMITPKSVTFDLTLMFYSDKAQCYYGSCKTKVTIKNLEKAGNNVTPPTFDVKDWSETFSDVTVGKQDKSKPGIVITDKSVEDFLQMSRLTSGKLDPNARGYNFRIRSVFANASRIDVVSATMTDVKWNESEYDFLVDEIGRRKKSAQLTQAGDSAKADAAYYDNRKYPCLLSLTNQDFWEVTSIPIETWLNYVETADKYYQKQQWNEAGVYYQLAAKFDTTIKYPLQQIEKIQEYVEYKNNRNISGAVDLVFVEGNSSIKSFYIGKTEVTQSQWARVMGTNPSKFNGCRDCPVENVSWNEVQTFITKLNEQTGLKYRLPSEQEWEYAARGGKNANPTSFAGGEDITDVAWCSYNSEQATHSVGQKSANELGIYDMTGNVMEWLNIKYDAQTRLVKGGSFSDDASGCLITDKVKYKPDYKSSNVGFRLCQDE